MVDDEEFSAVYGQWVPRTPADVAEVMAGYDRPWWIAGGWAIEACTGVSRPHHDIDPSVLAADLDAFRAHVAGRYDVWAAGAGALKPLFPNESMTEAEPLPHGFGQCWLRPGWDQPWEFDVLLAPGDAGTWVYRRDETITLPMAEALWHHDEIPYLAPQIQLLYKAKGQRPQDEADFAVCVPKLTGAQRDWLREMLIRALPGHDWIERLS